MQRVLCATSFAIVNEHVLIDPTSEEEGLASSTFNIIYTTENEVRYLRLSNSPLLISVISVALWRVQTRWNSHITSHPKKMLGYSEEQNQEDCKAAA